MTTSRSEKVAVVDRFFAGILAKDLAALPVDPDVTVQTPLTPKIAGPAAFEYLRKVAAGARAIRVLQHIVEGDWVATVFDEDTTGGRLLVFARFHVVGERIRDMLVFYDPRVITGGR